MTMGEGKGGCKNGTNNRDGSATTTADNNKPFALGSYEKLICCCKTLIGRRVAQRRVKAVSSGVTQPDNPQASSVFFQHPFSPFHLSSWSQLHTRSNTLGGSNPTPQPAAQEQLLTPNLQAGVASQNICKGIVGC